MLRQAIHMLHANEGHVDAHGRGPVRPAVAVTPEALLPRTVRIHRHGIHNHLRLWLILGNALSLRCSLLLPLIPLLLLLLLLLLVAFIALFVCFAICSSCLGGGRLGRGGWLLFLAIALEVHELVAVDHLHQPLPHVEGQLEGRMLQHHPAGRDALGCGIPTPKRHSTLRRPHTHVSTVLRPQLRVDDGVILWQTIPLAQASDLIHRHPQCPALEHLQHALQLAVVMPVADGPGESDVVLVECDG
mmetsp:Transcript_14480/g.34560  ORF Transcript_14480/g.34560 Transcript_14480/m.34560 type:complete len:245 (-) Transcript_14480:370-1104(-)